MPTRLATEVTPALSALLHVVRASVAASALDPVVRVWTIPAERMKAQREHLVPLCGRGPARTNPSDHNKL